MTRPLRILVVTNLYPPHSFGGYEDLCAGAVTRWRAGGHAVRVLTSRYVRNGVVARSERDVHRGLALNWADHEVAVPPLRQQVADQRTAARLVSRHVADHRSHVVSVWNPGALPLAGAFTALHDSGVPVALVVLDRWLTWGPDSDPWSARFRRPGWRALGPAASAVTGVPTSAEAIGARTLALFASAWLQRDAHAHGSWPWDDEALVPHGPDLHRYPLVPPHTELTGWRGRLLYVGRLAPEKGAETAVRALPHLPDARLDLHGTGPDDHVAHLRDLAATLGVTDRVALHGEADADRLRRAYDDADALLFTSVWPEPFGIVPLEAMARGLPVIATGTGGSGEFLVDGVTALRFTPRDERGLAERVRTLAADHDLRATLRQHGLETAGRLARDRVNEELLAWHRFAAGGSPRPVERRILPPRLAGPA